MRTEITLWASTICFSTSTTEMSLTLAPSVQALPNTRLGLNTDHQVMAEVPTKTNENPPIKETTADYLHLLSFFLEAAIGCRLVVLSRRDLDNLFDEIIEEKKIDNGDAPLRDIVPWNALYKSIDYASKYPPYG